MKRVTKNASIAMDTVVVNLAGVASVPKVGQATLANYVALGSVETAATYSVVRRRRAMVMVGALRKATANAMNRSPVNRAKDVRKVALGTVVDTSATGRKTAAPWVGAQGPRGSVSV